MTITWFQLLGKHKYRHPIQINSTLRTIMDNSYNIKIFSNLILFFGIADYLYDYITEHFINMIYNDVSYIVKALKSCQQYLKPNLIKDQTNILICVYIL